MLWRLIFILSHTRFDAVFMTQHWMVRKCIWQLACYRWYDGALNKCKTIYCGVLFVIWLLIYCVKEKLECLWSRIIWRCVGDVALHRWFDGCFDVPSYRGFIMTVSQNGSDINFCVLLWMFLFGGNLCGLYMISWI